MPSIVMPQLVEHMTEAVVARWLIADGDRVAVGDEVVEVETDKAMTAIESQFEGELRIVAGEGESVPVGELLCEVAEGGIAKAPEATLPPSAKANGAEAAPRRGEMRPEHGSRTEEAQDSTRVAASPLARRLAANAGVDLRRLSQREGIAKIRKADVEAAINGGGKGGAGVERSGLVAGEQVGTRQELTRTQQLIARRMSEAKATIPDFAVSIHVDMTACVDLRRQLKKVAAPGEPTPSINDMVVKATALTLRAFPKVNASYRGGAIELRRQVNVGIAVALEGSLVVPTIVEADRATLGAIARRARELAAAVRDGSITAAELAGGTFTVSNLGMYGVSDFTAVVNPPQAGILAVGAIEDRAVVRDGQVMVRAMSTLTLCSDHRVVYGADAAQFVSHLKRLLENPLAMAL